MKILSTVISLIIFNCVYSQNNELQSFNLTEFNELIKKSCYEGCEIETFGNKNFINFKRNDSIISMSYHKGGTSDIMKTFGNYYITYDFHPNLKIKSKKEFISAISRMSLQVGLETEYDEKGSIISQFNNDTMYYDENIPGPKKTVWEIANRLKKEYNFDILNDKSLFAIRIFLDKKTKTVNYVVSKLISDENKILKLFSYEYDGDSGDFIKMYNSESEIPDGLRHY